MNSAIDQRSPTQVQPDESPESHEQGPPGGAEVHEGLAPLHVQVNSLR